MIRDITQMGQVSNPSRSGIITRVTKYMLEGFTDAELADAELVEGSILDVCNDELDLQNSIRSKNKKWAMLKGLESSQMIQILLHKHDIRLDRKSTRLNSSHR